MTDIVERTKSWCDYSCNSQNDFVREPVEICKELIKEIERLRRDLDGARDMERLQRAEIERLRATSAEAFITGFYGERCKDTER